MRHSPIPDDADIQHILYSDGSHYDALLEMPDRVKAERKDRIPAEAVRPNGRFTANEAAVQILEGHECPKRLERKTSTTWALT